MISISHLFKRGFAIVGTGAVFAGEWKFPGEVS